MYIYIYIYIYIYLYIYAQARGGVPLRPPPLAGERALDVRHRATRYI